MLLAAVPVVLLRSLCFPPALEPPKLTPGAAPAAAAMGAPQSPPLEALASLWTRDWRQTLIEPPPKPAPVPTPPPPPEPIALPRLLATFVEQEQAWGLFVDASGAERVCPAGATINEFSIVAVQEGSATLKKGNQTYDVEVPKEQHATPRKSRRQG
ncbi:MAG: hypothetical protein HY763_02365 [Planctomycetes bacterium]|nr:hypothetical protein [Planctomycetota bacterium]